MASRVHALLALSGVTSRAHDYDAFDEAGLFLLQLHSQTVERHITNVSELAPWDGWDVPTLAPGQFAKGQSTYGEVKVGTPGGPCPAGTQELTYAQCTQLVRDNLRDRTGPFARHFAGHTSFYPPHIQMLPQSGLPGCQIWPHTGNAYYGLATEPFGNPRAFSPVCSTEGGRAQELIDFPVEPMREVQILELGEKCPLDCMPNIDQCLKIAGGFGHPQGKRHYSQMYTQVNPGGFGCYAPTESANSARVGEKTIFNPGDGVDGEGRPSLKRINTRQYCFCQPTTTTTPVPTTTTSAPITTTAAAMAPPEDDGASAIGDPHLHPIRSEDFTVH